MAIFYISDLHLGHANVIRFDNRPFADLDEMHREIIGRWNAAVTDEDTVYILGDFCWGKEADWLLYLPQLSGQKVLIRGNHDPKQFGAEVRKYFQDIREYKEITDSRKHVILCHYPIPFHRADYSAACWMLYGHVHITRERQYMDRFRSQIKANCRERGDCVGNWINVGCMMPWMDYTPQTLDRIIEREKAWREANPIDSGMEKEQ
ncbi:MAG: metallophosphoesterase family protein [Clostridia bacterium]|nr:metallophosphoesterase family protein [Clostridia bacterium]